MMLPKFPRFTMIQAICLALLLAVVFVDLILAVSSFAATDRRDSAQRRVLAIENGVSQMRRPDDLEALRRELAEAESRTGASPATFPKDVDSVALIGLVTNAARQAGVELSRSETGPQSTEKLGNNEYRALRYTIAARGQLPQLALFLNRLETSGFSTVTITGQTFLLQSNTWSLTLDLVAYAQKG